MPYLPRSIVCWNVESVLICVHLWPAAEEKSTLKVETTVADTTSSSRAAESTLALRETSQAATASNPAATSTTPGQSTEAAASETPEQRQATAHVTTEDQVTQADTATTSHSATTTGENWVSAIDDLINTVHLNCEGMQLKVAGAVLQGIHGINQ